MRKFILPLLFILCATLNANAQSFLDNLQKSKQGEGKVTVTQGKEIDNLVNGTNVTKTATPAQKTATPKTKRQGPRSDPLSPKRSQARKRLTTSPRKGKGSTTGRPSQSGKRKAASLRDLKTKRRR